MLQDIYQKVHEDPTSFLGQILLVSALALVGLMLGVLDTADGRLGMMTELSYLLRVPAAVIYIQFGFMVIANTLQNWRLARAKT